MQGQAGGRENVCTRAQEAGRAAEAVGTVGTAGDRSNRTTIAIAVITMAIITIITVTMTAGAAVMAEERSRALGLSRAGGWLGQQGP